VIVLLCYMYVRYIRKLYGVLANAPISLVRSETDLQAAICEGKHLNLIKTQKNTRKCVTIVFTFHST